MPILVIRKGHGGADPGAVGSGLKEADLTTKIVDKVIRKLAGFDVTIIESPRGGPVESALHANLKRADFYLSVHINAGGGTGFESYTHVTAYGEILEKQALLHSTIMEFMKQHGVRDRGIKSADFGELRGLTMPGVLIEVLFIDTEQDAAKLKDEAFLDGFANETAYAVSQVMNLQEKKPSNYCPDCAKLFAELQAAKQALKQVSGIAAPWMLK